MAGTGFFGPSGATVMAAILDESNNVVLAKGTVANIPSAVAGYAVGCEYIATDTGILYTNTGSITSCTFTKVGSDGEISLASGKVLVGNGSGVGTGVTPSGVVSMTNAGVFSFAAGQIQTVEVDLTPANIVSGTSIALVAAPGSGKYIQLLSSTISYTYSTAAYTGGGNVTLALGTTSVTGLISSASSFGKASNAVIQIQPLAAAAIDISSLTNTALNINVATGAFTQPGTAAGTAKVFVSYIVQTA